MSLQEVENAISAMNQAAFQELGDLFMISRNRDYSAFVCTGSQYGKQKTTKGTPDTFILTHEGKYIMVEYSTNETKKEKKLIEDFEKCLTEKGIEKSKLNSIILFANYKLNKEEVIAIQKYAEETHTPHQIYDGGCLARELIINHKNLVFSCLGIPVDTGQIVSVDSFVQEYDNAAGAIAAPLSNVFLYREQEIRDIKKELEEKDFILLHGAPGVGKTKLAIQAISEYCKDNLEFHVFCISYKGGELLTDLTCNIDLNEDNIVFVDDINRISSFNSIVGFYSSIRKGKLKIVMTVRDYALDQAKSMCYPHHCFELQVNPMSSEQISEIVRLGFHIENKMYLDKISIISKGNPRIAMMAGKLAIEKQNLQSLNDVSSLFDAYYGNIIDNIQYENKKKLKKCAGIIAFFSPLKYEGNEEFEMILNSFGISQSEFTECIDVLNRHEIVDLPQNTYAKISEQNLCMYMFYLAFIKEKVLSLETLFKYFYVARYQRFRDCIIPVNNTYGPENIEKAVFPDLVSYYNSVQDPKTRFLLLSDFWPYLMDETLAYISDAVYSLPSCSTSEFHFEKDESHFVLNTNANILDLSSKLFIFVGNELRSAIDLAFEYVRRKPSSAPNLVRHINEQFMYHHKDAEFSHYRQSELLNYVIEQIEKGDALCQQIMWHIAKLFLAFHTDYSGPIDDKNTFNLYQYPVPALKSILNLREEIWATVENNYSFDRFAWLLKNYTSSSWGRDNKLPQYDIPYTLEIIKKHLNSKSFEDCLCVQKYIGWAKRNGMPQKDYDFYYMKYRCKAYKFYVLLTWDRLRDKDQCDYRDIDAYHKYKLLELKKNFVYKTKQGYDSFLAKYASLSNNKSVEDIHNIKNSLNYIVSLAFESNFNLGCYFLKRIIQYNFQDFLPIALFANHLNSAIKAKRILAVIQSADFDMKSEWIIEYFEYTPITFLAKEDLAILLDAICGCSTETTIILSNLKKLRDLDSCIIDNILIQIHSLNEKGKKILLYDHDSELIYNTCSSKKVVQDTYLQQVKFNKYFDYELKGLLLLIQNNPHFLVDYIKSVADDKNEPDSNLSQIWNIEGIEPIVEEVLKYLRSDSKYRFYREDKWENALFLKSNDGVNLDKAKAFLEDQFPKALGDEKYVEQIVLIARGVFNDLYDSFICDYINYIDSTEDFFRIDWLNLHSGISVYGENTTFGDIEAARWSSLLSCLENVTNPKVHEIRAKIRRYIVSCQRQADDERARNQLFR